MAHARYRPSQDFFPFSYTPEELELSTKKLHLKIYYSDRNQGKFLKYSNTIK